ncbi:MAG: tRNA (adenosine(37)-N6)-threonylcarbamoyltransferase complex dimerization subunit type 1 TsaB, partial [Clostridia bacterium]|nr:tRNA (adenosine(37)-N6)-threonylcarbamoyltransferase complex dimerization subunit type 1 TsaB [Clostridia bacterium]
MKILCIDTSKKEALVALVTDEENYIIKMPETMKHSESLINYIEKALTDKNLTIKDMDALSCIVGPGSFTGIRVGMSVIKAMAFALDKNIIASNMFEVVAKTIKNGYFILNSTMT